MTPKQDSIYSIKSVESSTGKVAYITERKADALLSLYDSDSTLGAFQGWRFISLGDKAAFSNDGGRTLEILEGDTFRVVPYGAENLCLTSFRDKVEVKAYEGQINQHWKVIPTSDGNAVNLFVWSNRSNLERLKSEPDNSFVTRYWKDDFGNRTSFKLEEILPTAVPLLSGGEGVNLTLGPINNYIEAKGTKSAIMVFVDFPDTRSTRGTGTIIDAETLGKQLVGAKDEAEELFKDQSNEKFTLDIDVRSTNGWIELGENSTAYRDGSSTKITKLKTDYSQKLAGAESTLEAVNFDSYDMTFIVLPKEAAALNSGSKFDISPSYLGAKTIVFGADCYTTFYLHLVHEVAHQLSLPDLYPYQQKIGDVWKEVPPSEEHKEADLVHAVGCWSIMACMLNSGSFLGWERHKLGWLAASRELFLESPPNRAVKYTLTPLTEDNGIGMIVLPIDNKTNPSKVLVVEIAQDSYGIVKKDGKMVIKTDANGTIIKNPSRGILIYTVDAKIKSGDQPIRIIPQKFSKSDEYQELWEAPFQVGGCKEYTEGDFKVKVSVDKKLDDYYSVSISKS